MDYLALVGRTTPLLDDDIHKYDDELRNIVKNSKFLVIGGAGTIGQAVVKEIFLRNPKVLHVVDISENNMVELVRDIRSSMGYIDGDFKTFAIDCGSVLFEKLYEEEGPYDYVFNLSALKHVRSEKDPYTLMRMIEVNILNTIKTIELAVKHKAKKYFCVSTDKAANPVNMMGASKRIMEMFLVKYSKKIAISTARFANVAFSDGSLLHGFNQRIEKNQPIAAPNDVKRYFVIPKEAGQLCLMSALLGSNGDIFFPKLSHELHLETFSNIALRYLNALGYKPVECSSENEAREIASKHDKLDKKWPCYFFKSDTTGEKDFEEFFTESEICDFDRFKNLGIVKNEHYTDETILNGFISAVDRFYKNGWNRSNLIDLFNKTIPNFNHLETGKFLDQKM